MVDLWVEEEFNAGSRLVGGRIVHLGNSCNPNSIDNLSINNSKKHNITITNVNQKGKTLTFEVPQSQYILWEAEKQGLQLPYACRVGCCTACAVRVFSGQINQ